MPRRDRLTETIPIFPLSGVLLLPRGLLPLNIFEPRYINMVDDALAGDRLIGMVQPVSACVAGTASEVYRIGCAGRITSFEEADDGRYLITLTGVSRFQVGHELPTLRGYRRVRAEWDPFTGDCNEEEEEGIDRTRLTARLGEYFSRQGISANWEAIRKVSDERLVTSLAMICPFDPPEKQALLEVPTLAERADLLTTLIEMALLGGGQGDDTRRH